MALKRKRSSPAFSSPSSDSSSDATTTTTHLSNFYHASKPVESILSHKQPTWSWPTYDDSAAEHLNSRTRKRHRDNRPEEEQIRGVYTCWIGAVIQMSSLADVCRRAANTIHRLYEAQRLQPNAEPVLSQAATMMPVAQTQRSTLHSFWKLPPATTVPMAIDEGSSRMDMGQTRCEDCDRSLRAEDAMDLDDEETRCQACLRQVCDTCAVLGDRRVCLQCASHAH